MPKIAFVPDEPIVLKCPHCHIKTKAESVEMEIKQKKPSLEDSVKLKIPLKCESCGEIMGFLKLKKKDLN